MNASSKLATTSASQPSAGLIKRCVVCLVAGLAIGCLATVTLAGSSEDWGRTTPAWLDYTHGWPWTFTKRECPKEMPWLAMRFIFWSNTKDFERWSFAGDLFVLLAGSAGIMWMAGRSLRRRGLRISLARAGIWTAALCGVLSYLGWHYTTRVREEHAQTHIWGVGGFYREYCGPRWCVQLLGSTRRLRFFDHITQVAFSKRPQDIRETADALKNLPHLRVLVINFRASDWSFKASDWQDRDLQRLLEARSAWPIQNLVVDNSHFTGEAFTELHRCPQLQALVFRSDQLSSKHLHRLAQLPQLERLELHGLVDEKNLPRLVDCRQLQELTFDRCCITDAGLTKLAACPRLEQLSLRHTLVTERSIEILTAFSGLKKVNVGPFANRSPEELAAISERLGALKIESALYYAE